MHRRLLVSSLALASLLLGACSGGGDDDAAPPASTTTSTPAATAVAFTCPVDRLQLERAYPRIAFQDSTTSGATCTFPRFGESGSLAIRVDPGGAATYAGAVARIPKAEVLTGVGDEAVYDAASTTLVARHGDDVLVLTNRNITGFVGATDQAAALHDATIALAKVAVGT